MRKNKTLAAAKSAEKSHSYFLGAGAAVRICGHAFVDWLTRALQLQREAEILEKSR